VLTLEGSVAARDHVGGTAPNQVRAAVARAAPGWRTEGNGMEQPQHIAPERRARLLRLATGASVTVAGVLIVASWRPGSQPVP